MHYSVYPFVSATYIMSFKLVSHTFLKVTHSKKKSILCYNPVNTHIAITETKVSQNSTSRSFVQFPWYFSFLELGGGCCVFMTNIPPP